MAETQFLAAVAAWLTSEANLSPAPSTVGIAEPVAAGDLPAVVLSLESVQRPGNGLGERAELVAHGALQWTAAIDLAHPFLPEEPAFSLLSVNRKELVLPHGGLRQRDGHAGPLGPLDLTVSIGTVVDTDPAIGLLRFADALPPTGTLTATYFLGQWERRVTRLSGVLRVDVRAGVVDAVVRLSDGVVDALQANAVKGLHSVALTSLSSIGLPDEQRADSRARTAMFRFEYEHEVNRPDSSGGVIGRISVETRFEAGVTFVKAGKVMVVDREGTRNLKEPLGEPHE